MFIPLRDENPTRRFAVVTILLIVLNTGVFVFQVISPQGLGYHVTRMGVIPYEISHFRSLAEGVRLSPPLTLFAAMFIHGGFLHLAGNMLFLWVFGNNIEDALGPLRFILFYFLCGLGATFVQVAMSPNSRVPMIGASGAIAGILGAYLILFPAARVRTLVFLFFFIRVVAIPAGIVLGLWFVLQILSAGLGGGVAWFAHIGGFLLGIALIKAITRRRRSA
jgi:membrane associated rhomboid family serine protease